MSFTHWFSRNLEIHSSVIFVTDFILVIVTVTGEEVQQGEEVQYVRVVSPGQRDEVPAKSEPGRRERPDQSPCVPWIMKLKYGEKKIWRK